MHALIDFRQARFTACFENPYRITPPRRDTLYSKTRADEIDFVGHGHHSQLDERRQASTSAFKKDSMDTHINTDKNEAASGEVPVDSHTSSSSTPSDEYPRISISEVQDSLMQLFLQKKQQTSAFLGVVDAEINVIKTSIFATMFAGIAAVLLAGACWLMINGLIGIGLHSLGCSVVLSLVVLLVLNISLLTFTVYIAKKTSRYARFERIINVIKDL